MPGEQWQHVTVAGVELDAPAELAPEPGVEGGSVTLVGPDLRLIVDQSPFADPLTGYDSHPEFERRREEIGGEPVELVSFRAQDGTRVLATRLPGRLTAVAHASPDTDPEIPLRMLRSIRSPRREDP